MDDSDGGSSYQQTDEEDWSQGEEFEEALFDEEAERETPLWYEDYSNTDYEEDPADGDPEPEPPDYDPSRMSHDSWSGEEEGDEEERHDQNSWHEETGSQISLDGGYEGETEHGDFVHEEEEANHEGEWWREETEYQISLEGAEHDQTEPEMGDDYDDESMFGEEESEPQYISFSGHSQGPEAYFRWETSMEDWFQANHIPEDEKTSYAEDTLTEDAFRCWEQDAYARLEYDVPDSSWEEMKQMLHKEFVEDAVTNQQYYSKIYANPEPRRRILATRTNPKARKTHCSKPKEVSHHIPKEDTRTKQPARVNEVPTGIAKQTTDQDISAKPSLEPHRKTEQCKSSCNIREPKSAIFGWCRATPVLVSIDTG